MTSISDGHDPTAMSLSFHSFVYSPPTWVFVIIVAESRLLSAPFTHSLYPLFLLVSYCWDDNSPLLQIPYCSQRTSRFITISFCLIIPLQCGLIICKFRFRHAVEPPGHSFRIQQTLHLKTPTITPCRILPSYTPVHIIKASETFLNL